MPETLTTRQAARRLSCSPYVVRELCQAGKLPAIKLRDGEKSHWRIEPAAVEAYLKRHSVKQQTPRR